MKKAIIQTILSFALLLSVSKAAAQPANCYVQLDEASGFDVSSYQSELNLAACDLAASFPDSIENQFKVFSFGFYLNLEFYDEYSYPQAFGDMSAGVAQQSPYYLLIGRQSDHSGVFTRFWVDLKLPDTGIFSCATAEQLEALKTRLLVAIEYDYFKNGKLAPEYAQAEMRGMEALKEHVLSLYECCDPQNRGVGTCDDCASFATLAKHLELAGYSRTEFPSGLAYTLTDADDGYLKQNVQINIFEDGVNHNLNQEVRQFLDSINSVLGLVKADIQYYNSLTCLDILTQQQIAMDDENIKFKIIFAMGENNVPNLFFNYRFKLSEGNFAPRILISLPFSGHGLNFSSLKNELAHFLGLGGCSPEIIIQNYLLSMDWRWNDYAIIVGKNAKKRIQDFVLTGYCDFISRDFPKSLNDWVELSNPGESDGLRANGTGKIAVVDIANLDPSKLRVSNNINKAAAFVIFHELGHLTTTWGHCCGNSHPFDPIGLMDVPLGTYHVLGTGVKQIPDTYNTYDIYHTLEDLITDPQKKFPESNRNVYKSICKKL